jgi:uncharacterized phage protein (TIGR02220 family)
MNVLKMIGSTAFLMANKEIIRLTDIETAILYSDLAGAQDYWSEKNEIQDGYFYRTQNEIELNTTLSAKVQLRCLRLLQDKGLIKTKLKGLPAKKYFCIDSECMYRLSQVLQKGETCIAEKDNQVNLKSINKSGENVETSLEILDNQVSTKVLINNNRVNNNKEVIIDNNNKEKSDFSFSENTEQLISLNDKKELEKVSSANFVNNKNSELAESAKYFFEVTQVLALLTDRSGVKFVIPKTKSGIEKYEPYKLIKERISDGAKLEDIFAVVEMKNQEWQGTPIYKNFVPSTLFRKSNFEKYLQQLQLTYNNKQQNNLNNQFRTKKDENFAHYFNQLRDVDFSA